MFALLEQPFNHYTNYFFFYMPQTYLFIIRSASGIMKGNYDIYWVLWWDILLSQNMMV